MNSRPRDLVEEQFEQLAALAIAEAHDVAGEERVDEERLLPRHRMDAHDGMHRRRRRRVGVVALAGPALVAVPAVHRLEMVEEILDRRRQVLVRGDEVGPQRVAAVRRDHHAAQDRCLRRVRDERDVGVPAGHACDAARRMPRARPRTDRPSRCSRASTAMISALSSTERGDRVRGREVAERPAERDLLVLRDALIAEEEHLPLHQRVGESGDGRGVERLAEVDAGHLGPDDARQRANVEVAVPPCSSPSACSLRGRAILT